MPAKTLMIQGTGSHVGKSVIVAGLCRIFAQKGYRVAPFKSQNMALNSYVTRDGGEIGRAQAVQAQAAGIEPTVDMNPILLKPTEDSVAQVIVLGRPIGNMTAMDYHHFKGSLLNVVNASLYRLREHFDLVIIEGAGSPAEINLQNGDIANMKIAELADAPVVLVGDIDNGGVFASFVGTLELLEKKDRERIAGFIINKFRGDAQILEPALEFLEERTRRPIIGVVPYFEEIFLEEEDGVALERAEAGCLGYQVRESTLPRHYQVGGSILPRRYQISGGILPPHLSQERDIEIAVIRLPHISNFTDFDALAQEDGVVLKYISSSSRGRMPRLPGKGKHSAPALPGRRGHPASALPDGRGHLAPALPGRWGHPAPAPDLVIIPGSKNTINDLEYLWRTGLANEILTLAEAGVPIFGVCGGYQMLGQTILDPYGVESKRRKIRGLGLLNLVTEFDQDKTTCQVEAEVVSEKGILSACKGVRVQGYEIHMGRTQPISKVAEAGCLGYQVDGGILPPFLILKRGNESVMVKDGAISQDGLVFGTYIHGLFENDSFRKGFVDVLRKRKGLPPSEERLKTSHFREDREGQFNKLANLLRHNLDLDLIAGILEV